MMMDDLTFVHCIHVRPQQLVRVYALHQRNPREKTSKVDFLLKGCQGLRCYHCTSDPLDSVSYHADCKTGKDLTKEQIIECNAQEGFDVCIYEKISNKNYFYSSFL
jgi:hypothetical protein